MDDKEGVGSGEDATLRRSDSYGVRCAGRFVPVARTGPHCGGDVMGMPWGILQAGSDMRASKVGGKEREGERRNGTGYVLS